MNLVMLAWCGVGRRVRTWGRERARNGTTSLWYRKDKFRVEILRLEHESGEAPCGTLPWSLPVSSCISVFSSVTTCVWV